MPDLATILLRKSARSLANDRRSCSGCRRTPLVGERLHEQESGRVLCDLCVAGLPEDQRRTVSSERVRSAERQLAVVPRAA